MGLYALGAYVLLKTWHYHVESFSWISVVSLSATMFVQALAISSLTMTVVSEILPENIRECGVSFATATLGASAFIALKFSPFLGQFIGLYGLVFLFGGFCILGTLFVIFCVPETKGKNYDEIMKSIQ